MKKISFIFALLFALSLLTVTATAQSRALGHLDIPFSFTANDQVFAAGDYRILQIGAQVIRLEETATGKGITLLSAQNIGESPANTLVFRRYGIRYFLAKVVAPSYEIPLYKSTTEQEVASKMSPTSLTVRASR